MIDLAQDSFQQPRNARPLVIGVAGGSGSGKTTVSRAILNRVGKSKIAFLSHDSYYHDLSYLPLAERRTINFDHPDAFDNDLFVSHLAALVKGKAVDAPTYDYVSYIRRVETERVQPYPVVLVEGILIFVDARLREFMDIKLFVDAEPDKRFIRRLRRDTHERGRSVDAVIDQYLTSVRPMHLEFVEPSKRYADIIIPRGGLNTIAIDMVVARIELLLQQREHVI